MLIHYMKPSELRPFRVVHFIHNSNKIRNGVNYKQIQNLMGVL